MSHNKQKYVFWIICLLLLLTLAGCSSTVSKKALPYMKNEKTYLGLRDVEGHEIKNLPQPRRIVSLTIRSDEILMELAEEGTVIALSKWADDPVASNISEAAKQIPLRALPSEEMILGMKPDLVVASQSQPYDLIYRLRSLGIPVYVCPLAHNVKDTEKLILEFGKLLRREQKAKEMVDRMEEVIRSYAEKISKIPEEEKVTVYRFTVSGGNGGKNTYYDDICNKAGVKNAAAQMVFRGTQLLPKEQVLQMNPDVIFLPTWDWSRKMDLEAYKRDIVEDPALQTVKAIKNKRLYVIPDTHMLCSSQYMVECIKDIYEACYGEKSGMQIKNY